MKPFVIAVLFSGLGDAVAWGQWQPQAVRSDADFRGLCAVGPNVAWVGGTKGTFGRTTDGGKTWAPLPEKSRPAALPKEGAFAASGTCLVTRGDNDVWFCTGGARAARVFRSGDRGKTWNVSETPLLAGVESGGAFSIAFRDRDRGVIVGGDYPKPDGPVALGRPAVVLRQPAERGGRGGPGRAGGRGRDPGRLGRRQAEEVTRRPVG